ncbi:MAG: hypothetical protein IMY77_00600 [Chloroflexi bacterium]|nr:hypothetical protein [Chloroflexota bacterium]
MKCYRVFCGVALGIIFALLMAVFPTIPVHAEGELITLYPAEGEIGEKIDIEGGGFGEGSYVYIYFSGDAANEGDDIDGEVTHYKLLERNIRVSEETSLHPGEFNTYFKVPEELDDGESREDVHCGDYYVYATYRTSKDIIAVARFAVIGCKIELAPEEGTVGTEVKVSGEGLCSNKEITARYDDSEVDIISGDTRSDEEGQFVCTIIVPESTVGNHIIAVVDESGSKPETGFCVKPAITVNPSLQAVDGIVNIRGTGFEGRERITIVLDGGEIFTTPVTLYTSLHTSLHTNYYGSFNGSFIVPPYPAYVGGGTGKVKAYDDSFNVAESELTVVAIPASISLCPTTSLASPGHAGMELTVDGTWFIADTTVTITYTSGDILTVATARTSESGDFSVTFTVPPSAVGGHAVTATDGTNRVTTIFTMESETPPMPVPRLPEVTATVEGETYFDWEDVTDPSDITYVLQIGADSDFAVIVLEKEGLAASEYTLTEEEKLESSEKEMPYYWRVKAIDGAFNESGWTAPSAFYVGTSWVSIPTWIRYIWIGLGISLAAILIFRMRRRVSE